MLSLTFNVPPPEPLTYINLASFSFPLSAKTLFVILTSIGLLIVKKYPFQLLTEASIDLYIVFPSKSVYEKVPLSALPFVNFPKFLKSKLPSAFETLKE